LLKPIKNKMNKYFMPLNKSKRKSNVILCFTEITKQKFLLE